MSYKCSIDLLLTGHLLQLKNSWTTKISYETWMRMLLQYLFRQTMTSWNKMVPDPEQAGEGQKQTNIACSPRSITNLLSHPAFSKVWQIPVTLVNTSKFQDLHVYKGNNKCCKRMTQRRYLLMDAFLNNISRFYCVDGKRRKIND